MGYTYICWVSGLWGRDPPGPTSQLVPHVKEALFISNPVRLIATNSVWRASHEFLTVQGEHFLLTKYYVKGFFFF
jgi:hypothetical protein